jgi:hypothetical protein
MLENLVVSSKTAEKLKAAGWNTETIFMHAGIFGIQTTGRYGNPVFPNQFFAPTAEEILRELPPAFKEKYK